MLPASPSRLLCNDSPTIRELASGEASFDETLNSERLSTSSLLQNLEGCESIAGEGAYVWGRGAHYDAWWGPDPGFGKNSTFHQDRETGKSTSAFLEVKHYWSQDVLEEENTVAAQVLGMNVDESKRGKRLGCFSRRLHRLRTHAWEKRYEGMGWRADVTWSSRRLLPLYLCLVGFGQLKVYQVCPLDAAP